MSLYKKKQDKNKAHDEMMRQQFANQVSLTHLADIQLQGKNVLDVGCGVSTSLPAFLHERGATYQLLDYKQSSVETMREALEVESLPVNISQGNIMKLQFEDESFDFVHERLVLMHVSDPAQGIRECLRVARQAVFFVSIDWGTFRWKTSWVGDFYMEALAFVEERGSNMSFGGKVASLLPHGANFTCTPYERPWGEHGYIVSSLCETLLGMNPDERLRKFFTKIAKIAKREGAWVKPALMSVVTVLKEQEPQGSGLDAIDFGTL